MQLLYTEHMPLYYMLRPYAVCADRRVPSNAEDQCHSAIWYLRRQRMPLRFVLSVQITDAIPLFAICADSGVA